LVTLGFIGNGIRSNDGVAEAALMARWFIEYKLGCDHLAKTDLNPIAAMQAALDVEAQEES
jgi:hypothetical protein|tara:strand:- start:103 stop:285 length:183 start_codon:yes stop_codon:yes gene_type:complete